VAIAYAAVALTIRSTPYRRYFTTEKPLPITSRHTPIAKDSIARPSFPPNAAAYDAATHSGSGTTPATSHSSC
jgi:hypothetical protein